LSAAAPARYDSASLLPIADVSAASLLELQRKMQEMQEELLMLRTEYKRTEVQTNLENIR